MASSSLTIPPLSTLPPPPPLPIRPWRLPSIHSPVNLSAGAVRLAPCSPSSRRLCNLSGRAVPAQNDSQVSGDGDAIRAPEHERLKVAFAGFGNLGKFLGRKFVEQGHEVIVFSYSDESAAAARIGAELYRYPDDMYKQLPDVVIICAPIFSTDAVLLEALPMQRLGRSALIVDVVVPGNVFSKDFFLSFLPSNFDILRLQTMFPPERSKRGWKGLPFGYEKVRLGRSEESVGRYRRFLDIFTREGCRLVEREYGEQNMKDQLY